jgi:predicted ATPase/DNA-binding XRE family transcriptional regulator
MEYEWRIGESVRAAQESPFGTKLKRLREAAGLTQEELAGRAGLTRNAVSALERGERRRPYPHTVRAIADALGLSDEERSALVAVVAGKAGDHNAGAAEVISEPLLPIPATPLLGRERDLREVRNLLCSPEVRLLTLTGVGGVGKTRLAVQAARDLAEHFANGVVFVTLAPLGDPDLVLSAIVRIIGVTENQGASPRTLLEAYLRDKQLLLSLDNFEHLAEAAPEVVQLLGACPGLSILATSRAPLKVRGEQEYPVEPLALPASAPSPSPEEVLASPSGRLFVERAGAAFPSFSLTTDNAPAVAAICWRLAGIPLALELAAARARFLGPRSLLERLDQALSTGWARDLPERQKTIRATLDWSFDLLSEEEKALFRVLSVFAGGFTLEAAEAVGAAAPGVESREVLGLLERLVEHSLVTADAGGSEARYGMLEPVRQYAGELLDEGDDVPDSRRHHARYFLTLAEQARPELRGARQIEWLETLERENGNLRAAMGWALDKDIETAVRLGWALWGFWVLRGHEREGYHLAKTLLARDIPEALRPRAVFAACVTAWTQGDHEAVDGLSAEALAASRLAGDDLCAAHTLWATGVVAMNRGDLTEATDRLAESLSIFDRFEAEGMAPMARYWLGTAAWTQGDTDRAVALFEEALAMARERGDRIAIYGALFNLARVALANREYAAAERMIKEAVALSAQVGSRAHLAYFLEGAAAAAEALGQIERSARLIGAAEGLRQHIEEAPFYKDYRPNLSLRDHTATALRSQLGEAGFDALRAEGREMLPEQAVEYALDEKN